VQIQECCFDNIVVVCRAVSLSLNIFSSKVVTWARTSTSRAVSCHLFYSWRSLIFSKHLCLWRKYGFVDNKVFLLYMSVCSFLDAVDKICIFSVSPKYLCRWVKVSCNFHCIFPEYLVCWLQVLWWCTEYSYCAWVWGGLHVIHIAVDSFCS
jgi:hypothetical protein